MQGAIIPPHAAVVAVLPAMVGNLNDRPHEDVPAKLPAGGGGRAFVKGGLPRTVLSQFACAGKETLSGHRQIKSGAGGGRKFFAGNKSAGAVCRVLWFGGGGGLP
jgi:hypothetical protein